MCLGIDLPEVNGRPPRRPALASLAPGAQPKALTAASASAAGTTAPRPKTVNPEGVPTPGTQPTTPTPNSPANLVPPDATSEDAIQARLRERQQIELLAGYRGTFMGPRGPVGSHGPSRAEQEKQLRPPPGLAFTPLESSSTGPTSYPKGGAPGSGPHAGGSPYPKSGTPVAGPVNWGSIFGNAAPSVPGQPVLSAFAGAAGVNVGGAINTSDEYITDANGVLKRNPNYRPPSTGWNIPILKAFAL